MADHYYAETENGHRLDDPSEDGLFDVIGELDHADNTFWLAARNYPNRPARTPNTEF